MSTEDTTVESPIEGHIGEETTLTTLREGLENNDYTGDEIQAAIEAEKDRPQNEDGARKGAIDALNEAFNEATSGPTMPDGDDPTDEEIREATTVEDVPETTTAMDIGDDDVDENGRVRVARAADGMGATEAGSVGVVLPSPYADDAPDTVRVFTPVEACIGQDPVPFDVGAHDVPYTMQVKNQLETDTNRLRLDRSDPMHPAHTTEE